MSLRMFVSRSVSAVSKAAAALLALALLAPAHVSAKDVTERVMNACRSDYRKFCPSYSVNTPELNNCMEKAGKRLTPRCLDALIDDGLVPRKYLKR